MDSWPANDRNDLVNTTGRQAKPKRKEKDVFPNYPDIVQGSLNAVTLADEGSGFEWLPIMKNLAAKGETRLHIEKSQTIFPPTRPPVLRIPQITIRQRAEQGANFLRTFLPDVDIPAELIRNEIAQDARVLYNANHFDPYIGKLLEPIVAHGLSSETAAFLAFPMGELNRDLNISVIAHSEIEGTLFKPSARPIRTYDTPIQQITSSKPRHDIPQSSCVAVRTFGSTSLLKLVAPTSTNHNLQAVEMATVQHGDVGNRAIVDVKLSPSPTEVLAINDRGELYKFIFDNGRKTSFLVHAATVDNQDPFWRVATSGNDTCLLMSKKALKYLDFRTDDYSNLFSISRPQDVLTSVEDDDGSNVVRLCSTREILWIDKRFPAKPLLGYRHGRNWDRSLLTQTLHMPHALTLLTSRSTGLVTVYDISRSTGSLLHLNTPPHCLWPTDEVNSTHCGQAFFRHPLASHNEDFNMFQLSDRGSVLRFGLDELVPSANRFSVFLSNDMERLEQQASALRSDDGPLGCRDFSEIDFVLPYNHLFRPYAEERGQAEEESADALYNLLDEIPTFWRDSDAPIEQMLTTYDVLFRTGTEPTEALRADFLTEGLVNSTRGYRALVQERLSVHYLISDAAWHLNIIPVLKKFDPGFSKDAQEWNESLHRHDLRENPDRPVPSTRREKEAREYLTLDLSLSTDVFSAQRFSKVSDGNMELEEMTKTLSIVGELPDVAFGYFRPLPKNATDHYTRTENVKVTMSIGARMLIKEWQLGEDPDMYDFRNRYSGTTDPQNNQRTKFIKPPTQVNISELPQPFPNSQSQRPPLVVATTTLPFHKPEVHMRSYLKTQSSLLSPQFGSQVAASAVPPATQECMTSTQVLPGPYGGRPSVGKKKPTKKRLGGF